MEVGKVNKITTNSQKISPKELSAPSFRGGVRVSANANEALTSRFPKTIKIIENLRVLKGEAGGIIINALGTGLVAPIFIAYNPLSKADEDTKKYTAMRQPVSAVLAILIQAGLTKPLSNLYAYLSNNGKLGNSVWFNQSSINSESYLKRQLKTSDQNVIDKKIEEQIKHVAQQFEETGEIKFVKGRNFEPSEIKKLMEKTIDSYIEKIDEKIEIENKRDVDAKIKRAQVLCGSEKKTKNIISMCEELKGVSAQKEISSILKNYIESSDADIKMLASEFKERGSIEEIKRRADQTIEKCNIFRSAVKQCEFLSNNSERLVKALENSPEDAVAILKEFKSEVAGKTPLTAKYADLLENHIKTGKTREYADRLIKNIENINKVIENGSNNSEIIAEYQKMFYAAAKDCLNNQKLLFAQLKTKIKSWDSGIMELTKLVQKSLKVQQSLNENYLPDFINKTSFAKDVIKTFQKTSAARLKGFTQIVNIFVGAFITLPVTCNALNWCYPKFMNVFFPGLSKKDNCEAPEEAKKGGK